MPRRWSVTIALVGALVSGAVGCSKPAPPEIPTARVAPYTTAATTPLGRALWRAFAVSPDGRSVAVASRGRVSLLAWPSLEPRWARPGPPRPWRVAFGRGGAELAVLADPPDGSGGWAISVYATGGGTSLGKPHLARAPPRKSGGGGRAGIEPPHDPTAFGPAPGGRGYYIANAYGLYHAAPGSRVLGEIAGGPRHFIADRDGRTLWASEDERRFAPLGGGDAAGFALPCSTRMVAVDRTLGRVAYRCRTPGPHTTVTLAELASGTAVHSATLPRVAEWLAIVDADTAIALVSAPRRLGVIAKGSLRWVGLGGEWGRLALSPDGRYAVAVGAGGEGQVLDRRTKRVVCDHVQLGDTRGAGFATGGGLWLIGARRKPAPGLEVRLVELPSCTPSSRRPLNLQPTGAFFAEFLRQPRAFLLTADLPSGESGIVYLPLAAPNRPIHVEQRGTFTGGPRGARFATIDDNGGRVHRAEPQPDQTGWFPGAQHIALCAGATLIWDSPRGWRYAADGKHPRLRIQAGYPTGTACRDDTLAVVSHNLLVVVDVAARRERARLRLPHPARAIALTGDARTAIVTGGPTGVLEVALPPPRYASPRRP